MADTSPRRVCVIGLGYVGLPTAASIAAQGVEVIGVDVDAERLSAIASEAAPTTEEDLNELVRTVVAAGTLSDRGDPAAGRRVHHRGADAARTGSRPGRELRTSCRGEPGAPAASRQSGGAGVHVPGRHDGAAL